MSLSQPSTAFAQTPYARLIDEQVSDPSTLARIVALSEKGRPAITALDDAFHQAFGDLDDNAKKGSGRHLRDILSRHGLRPVRKGQRVSGGKVFHNGSVYAFTHGAKPSPLSLTRQPTVQERVDAAIAILEAGRFGDDAGTVDDFIADRRREALREAGE